MTLTPALKQWLREQKGLTAEATDDEYRKAAMTALLDKSLTGEKFAELSADPDAKAASSLEQKLDAVLSAIQRQVSPATVETEETQQPQVTQVSKEAPQLKAAEANGSGDGEKKVSHLQAQMAAAPEQPSLEIRQVGAEERYSKAKTELRYPEKGGDKGRHPLAGKRVADGGRPMDQPSELDYALVGATLKWQIHNETGGRGIPTALRMTDHDWGLINYALHEEKWCGVIGGVGDDVSGAVGLKGVKLNDLQRKQIIADATSGGTEAVPLVFDEAIIQVPLLTGEFFPSVNVVNITQGRRIDGSSWGTVTLSSGGADATDIPLLTTASFIAAFDTTIYVVNGAVEVGMDFMSDTPVNVGQVLSQQYGQRLLQWLDDQIVGGDGTTEPEGILTASGTTTVNQTAGGAAATVGDYEGLLFGVPKNYKQGFASNRIAYGANELTYQRARGIAVSGTDQRRVFGMTHEDYMMFGHPYRINESFTNAQRFFANLARYRMYRRLGLVIRTTTEGRTLVRGNLMLMTARARFGGQLEDGAAAAITTNGQT